MKKIFTLFAFVLLAAAAMAADRYPSVIINSSKNFRIVVDGKSYFANNSAIRLDRLSNGFHTIKVYELRRGLFVRGEKLVTATSFKLGRQDVRIKVDYFGRVEFFRMKQDRRYDRDRYNDRDNDRDSNWERFDNDDDGRDRIPSRRF